MVDGASMDVGVRGTGAASISDTAIDIDAIFDALRRSVASVMRGVDVTEIYLLARGQHAGGEDGTRAGSLA